MSRLGFKMCAKVSKLMYLKMCLHHFIVILFDCLFFFDVMCVYRITMCETEKRNLKILAIHRV